VKSYQSSAISIESTLNLWAELRAATYNTASASKKLIQACATQAALARYRCPEKNIRPLALNTLKAAAEEAVELGGWKQLNELRRTLHARGLSGAEQRRKTNRGLGHRLNSAAESNKALQARIKNLLRSRVVMLQAYGDIVDLLKTYQHLDANLAQRLKRHERMFDLKLIAAAENTDEQV
jgi:hypothetical protein